MTNTKLANDGIDLIDLIKVLWKKKGSIALTTAIFTLLAGFYAFTAKEQWTSQAEIIEPQIRDLGNYFDIKKRYSQIIRSELDETALPIGLYAKFDRFIQSIEQRSLFFSQSEVYKEEIKDISDETEQRKILDSLSTEMVKIIKPDLRKYPNAIGQKVSFSAETPALAQNTLTEFINFMSQEASKLEVSEFEINYRNRVKDLEEEKERFEIDLSIQRQVQLSNLKSALSMANKAGIREYSAVLDSKTAMSNLALSDTKIPLSDSKLADGAYLFMLGEKYLQAQIDVVENQGIIYPPRYYQLQDELSKLKALEPQLQQIKTQAYSYHSSASYPVIKDQPKKAIILILGLLLGGILSSGSVLVRYFIKNEK